ncbi:MAG TPA: hypothetical protein VER96_26060 [Polyangiaceae bacterium]|nr:hypothetical protein [Polyangiaceae bacterium]
MRLAIALAALLLGACAGSAQGTYAQDAAEPRPTGVSDARAVAGHEDTALLWLIHKWARGHVTVVGVYRQGYGYVLSARNYGCATGTTTQISEPSQRAELERVLTVLDPKSLPEGDPCSRSVRDGTGWAVRVEVDGEVITRGRQFGVYESGPCVDFQRAAQTLMNLAGLECTAATCVRVEGGSGARSLCP